MPHYLEEMLPYMEDTKKEWFVLTLKKILNGKTGQKTKKE